MSLGSTYIDAYQATFGLISGWIVNWPPATPIRIGDVGRLVRDDDTGIWGFNPGASLNDHDIPYKAQSDGVVGDRTLTVGDETNISFGFSAETPGFKWLGDASAGFHASFGSEGGMQAHVENIRRQSIENIDALKPMLLDAVSRGSMSLGHAVIVERETADLGMIIASERTAGDLKVKTNAALVPGGQPLAKFAANFTVHSASGGAATQPMSAPFPVIYKTLVVGRRGIWWWKKVVIEGVADMSEADRLRATEDALDADDYYARF